MQTLVDAATHIADEITRTREHLATLERALSGMQPLLQGPEQDAVQKVLGYSSSAGTRVLAASDVEILEPRARDATPSGAPQEVAAADEPAAMPVGEPETANSVPKRAKVGKTARTAKSASGRTATRTMSGLPSTGGEFWATCMGRGKHTAADVVQKALAKLSLDESAKPVMSNRFNTWLYSRIQEGKVQPAGDRAGLKLYQRTKA